MDEKKARRDLTNVQSKFRKVKSLNQLYWDKWETRVKKGRMQINSFFITEYVLQKFEEGYDRRSIIHDMNLRL